MLSFSVINRLKTKWSVKIFIGFNKISVKSDTFPFGMDKLKITNKNFFIYKNPLYKNLKNPSNKASKSLNNSLFRSNKANLKRRF